MSPAQRLQTLAIFLLRLALGVMFLTHGFVLKVLMLGPAGTAQFFGALGFPAAFAYAVMIAETVGGLMLIFGVQVRWVSLALTPILLGALWVHSGNGWLFESPGGGWEYPLHLAVLGLAQAMLGEGAFALSPSWPVTFWSGAKLA